MRPKKGGSSTEAERDHRLAIRIGNQSALPEGPRRIGRTEGRVQEPSARTSTHGVDKPDRPPNLEVDGSGPSERADRRPSAWPVRLNPVCCKKCFSC